MIPEFSFSTEIDDSYNDSSAEEELQEDERYEAYKLDESTVNTLNRKLCTYDQSMSSEEEDTREENEEESMRSLDVRINKDTLEVGGGEESLSEDEFEKEMEEELEEKVIQLKEGMGGQEEEQFYDPLEDAKDQAWEDETRRRYLLKPQHSRKQVGRPDVQMDKERMLNKREELVNKSGKRKARNQVTKLPSSDAVLNCPCCMCLLCLDCQRHVNYSKQYRAMFVSNCRVLEAEVLCIPEKSRKRKRREGGGNRKEGGVERVGEEEVVGIGEEGVVRIGEEGVVDKGMEVGKIVDEELRKGLESDYFKGVDCEGCGTRVALFDSQEVYHFFNVLASY